VLDALLPAILEQKVTGTEARRAWQGIVRAYGESAPDPAGIGLRLTPRPETLARLPYFAYHPFGVERRRADLIRMVASRPGWFEATAAMPLPDAYARLRSIPGIGPWTAAEVAVRALGDRDAVSVGDFHLPHLVSWALAGEPRGDDDRMLALLEPYRGDRALVVRLLESSGLAAPRYAPRLTPRRIEGI
jgi:3-methyladenine DNA glycosylase/8-oxoguanine DNA glycosylase